MSIRFFKRLRRAEGLFATDRCRPPVAELDAVQQRQADALVARALALQTEAARRGDAECRSRGGGEGEDPRRHRGALL